MDIAIGIAFLVIIVVLLVLSRRPQRRNLRIVEILAILIAFAIAIFTLIRGLGLA